MWLYTDISHFISFNSQKEMLDFNTWAAVGRGVLILMLDGRKLSVKPVEFGIRLRPHLDSISDNSFSGSLIRAMINCCAIRVASPDPLQDKIKVILDWNT